MVAVQRMMMWPLDRSVGLVKFAKVCSASLKLKLDHLG